MNEMTTGALAGFAATVPMTWAMEVLHRRLPDHERHPLPPREITERVAAEAGVADDLSETEHVGLALAGHFGYGTVAGALYGPVARHLPLPPVAAGMAYGLAVWAGSYLGLLPALGIMSPATRHPPRRTGVMIAAHLVWGAALGVLVDSRENTSQADGRRR